MVLHGRQELSLMSDEYGALTMVLLRFLAFPAGAGGSSTRVVPAGSEASSPVTREIRAAPLRAPAPPALAVVPPAAPVRVSAPYPAPAPARAPVAASPSSNEPPPWDGPPPWDEEEHVPPAPSPSRSAAAAPQPASRPAAEVPCTELGDRWYALVKPLCEQGVLGALARELAMQAGLRAIDSGATPERWHLLVERETLRTAPLRDKVTAALTEALGHPVQLELEAGTPEDSPARRDVAERQRRQLAAEDLIQTDPVVRELLGQFKTARIVPGSIKPLQP
jgi:DNA polymerase III subunit gamma/tau